MTKFVTITYHPTIMRYDEIEKIFRAVRLKIILWLSVSASERHNLP